jgi:hypothetical protein
VKQLFSSRQPYRVETHPKPLNGDGVRSSSEVSRLSIFNAFLNKSASDMDTTQHDLLTPQSHNQTVTDELLEMSYLKVVRKMYCLSYQVPAPAALVAQ